MKMCQVQRVYNKESGETPTVLEVVFCRLLLLIHVNKVLLMFVFSFSIVSQSCMK